LLRDYYKRLKNGEGYRMKILLLMAKGVELLEASAFIDVIGWHREYCNGNIEVVTCSLDKRILSTFNIPIEVDELVENIDVEEYDALAIPGGFGTYGFYDHAFSDSVQELIRAFDNQNKFIASICVGALPLGHSGVLKNRRATTYHLMNKRRQIQLADYNVEIVNEPIVVDGNIITSWCPSTAVGVAFELLAQLANEEDANQIRSLMGY
jgi:4-methyl-5(b-hydroxyethyl)-thiazole monophosphate biosynthesis